MARRIANSTGGEPIIANEQHEFDGSGNEAVEAETIDPATIFAGTDEPEEDNFARDANGNLVRNKDGSFRKKRGRKSGSKNGGSSAKGNSSLVKGVDTLAQSLMVVHLGLASFTKFDQFALTEIEANNLSSSVVNVMSEFDIAPDPRLVAVTGLVTTASMIYGPRIYNYAEHKAKLKKEKEIETTMHHTFVPNDDSIIVGGASYMRGN